MTPRSQKDWAHLINALHVFGKRCYEVTASMHVPTLPSITQ